MQSFVRAVVTALYTKVAKELGFDDKRHREAALPVEQFGVASA